MHPYEQMMISSKSHHILNAHSNRAKNEGKNESREEDYLLCREFVQSHVSSAFSISSNTFTDIYWLDFIINFGICESEEKIFDWDKVVELLTS